MQPRTFRILFCTVMPWPPLLQIWCRFRHQIWKQLHSIVIESMASIKNFALHCDEMGTLEARDWMRPWKKTLFSLAADSFISRLSGRKCDPIKLRVAPLFRGQFIPLTPTEDFDYTTRSLIFSARTWILFLSLNFPDGWNERSHRHSQVPYSWS